MPLNFLKAIATGGAAGLGTVLADPDERQKIQNVYTPAPRPVNPSSFSFDFSGALQKLFAPKPKETAMLELGRQAEDILKVGIQAAGSVAKTAILDVISGADKKKVPASTQSQQPAVTAPQTMPTQTGSNINEILQSFISGAAFADELRGGSSSAGTASETSAPVSSEDQLRIDAANATTRNVLIFGGGALLLVLLLTGRKGR